MKKYSIPSEVISEERIFSGYDRKWMSSDTPSQRGKSWQFNSMSVLEKCQKLFLCEWNSPDLISPGLLQNKAPVIKLYQGYTWVSVHTSHNLSAYIPGTLTVRYCDNVLRKLQREALQQCRDYLAFHKYVKPEQWK